MIEIGNTNYTLKDATTDVENALNNGSTLVKGFENMGQIDVTNIIIEYNHNNEPAIIPTSEFIPTRKTIAIPRPMP